MEKQIKLAQKLKSHRETAKSFYGKEFHEKIAPYILCIKNYSEKHGTETLKSVIDICSTEEIKGHGFQTIMFMAAAVEIIEPSK
jgi:uncharacterized membrane protein